MRITEDQYEKIASEFPKPRKPSSIDNVDVLNALLYVLENGCKWRALPKEFGNWHTIYTRLNRWAKSGVLNRVMFALQQATALDTQEIVLALDSTAIKVHPNACGALKKTGNNPLAEPKVD